MSTALQVTIILLICHDWVVAECTIASHSHCVAEQDLLDCSIPIGKSLPNTTSYVLEATSLVPIPIGVPGELYIGGPKV